MLLKVSKADLFYGRNYFGRDKININRMGSWRNYEVYILTKKEHNDYN